MTRDQINVLSRGLKFIPTPVTNTGHVRAELLKDFNAFARRMRLQYIFHGKDKEQHPFHVKSDWEPPVQPSVALETYLEEVKLQLANINTITPRNNLPKREQLAIKQLKQNPDINIKRADKGSSIVVLNKEDKIKEGQIQLDDRENYKPLETPMVVETSPCEIPPCNSMEFHGNPWKSMKIHGNPWKSIKIHGIAWKSMEIHGIPRNFHGVSMEYPWSSMECHGVP